MNELFKYILAIQGYLLAQSWALEQNGNCDPASYIFTIGLLFFEYFLSYLLPKLHFDQLKQNEK